jgi:hypothetical protein
MNDNQERLELEGDKKVVRCVFLEQSIFKMVGLGLPLCLSVIGIYFLIKSKLFRSKAFFNSSPVFDPDHTTHVFI